MAVLRFYMCIYPCPQSPEDSIRFPGAGVSGGCVIICDWWELNSDPLQEQQVIRVSIPSIIFYYDSFYHSFFYFLFSSVPSLLFFVFSHCRHLQDTLHHMRPLVLSPFLNISWPPLMISCLVSLTTPAIYTLIYIHKNMKSLNQSMRENKTCKVCVPENWISSLILTKPFRYKPRRDIAESH